MPLGADDWISTGQAERHLNKSALQGDELEELIDFIQRAERAVIDRIGYVKQPAVALVEFHDGGRSHLRLEHRPVFDITEISVAGTVEPAADLEGASPTGWYIHNPRSAVVKHTGRFPTGFVRVEYLPGWDVIPESLTLATLELLRHLWKTQRGSVGGRPGKRGETPVDPTQPVGTGFTMPHRVTQLLHPFTQVPVA